MQVRLAARTGGNYTVELSFSKQHLVVLGRRFSNEQVIYAYPRLVRLCQV